MWSLKNIDALQKHEIKIEQASKEINRVGKVRKTKNKTSSHSAIHSKAAKKNNIPNTWKNRLHNDCFILK